MSTHHHHHAHGEAPAPSFLRLSAWQRLACAAAALAPLWFAVAWAISR